MTYAEHVAHFLKLAARPFDRNRTPLEMRAVTDEELWRDVTPVPEPARDPLLPPARNDFSTDFSEQPTKEITP
jgi:hypothetical protein